MHATQSQISTILEALNAPTSRGSLVLLDPQSRTRSLVVAALLEQRARPVYYYALGPDDADLSIFLTGLGMALADQKPLAGRHLLAHLGEDGVDEDRYMQALLSDLYDLGDDYVLVLDEYDRCDESDEMQSFMTALACELPPNLTIVINSRTVPRLPWVALTARRCAIVLSPENSQPRMPSIYPITLRKPVIETYALGPGFVLLNDTPVDDWEGHLPRLLFFFVLERPAVTRSEICAAFWPLLNDEQAVNVFHVTKRRLHKALGLDVLIHENGFYILNPEIEICCDTVDFVDCLIRARHAPPDERPGLLQNAVDIYRGPFLQGHNDDWIAARRADYLNGYIEALDGLAAGQINAGRNELALSTLLRAAGADPMRPEIQVRTLRLYITMGRRYEAAAHYQALQDRLKKTRQKMWPEVQQVFGEIAALVK